MKARWLAGLMIGMAGVASSQMDYFAFIPEGGRSLLQNLLADDPELAAELTETLPALSL